MGGGPDVNDAFKWMIKKAGGGNFVILRSRGTDAYNSYVYAMGGVSSVETIIIPSREAASDPFVIARIQGGTVDYSISAINGVLTSSQPGGSIY